MAVSKAVVKGTLGGTVQVRNVFTASIVLSGGETMGAVWAQYLSPLYVQVMYVTANIYQSYAFDVLEPGESGWFPIDTVEFINTGAGTTAWLPNAVAAVLLGKAAGLRHVGRKFFSAIGISGVEGNSLGATFLGHLADALYVYLAPFTTFSSSTFTPGITDKFGTFHPFVGGIVNSLLGSQRRRKPGVGI